MNNFSKIAMATAAAATAATSFAVPADAATRRHHYSSRSTYAYRVCRHSQGTTGLLAGGVAGAVVGRKVVGKGILGTAAGVVGGALAGRAVDRTMTAPRRCYYRR
ncbi:MAG: hypothetical protein ABIQ32_08550 [Sphingomicrobium sp.]